MRKHARIFFSFGAIQAMQLVIPLLAFPWLGRKLGAETFGLLMYMALIPPVIALFMEWGISLGGARDAARLRTDMPRLISLLGAVFSSKIILAAMCVLGGALVFPVVPHAEAWPLGYAMAICLGLVRGLSPLWYYQGIGAGMEKLAIWDVIASLAGLGLIFIFIRKPEDWILYLVFTSVCKGAVYIWLDSQLWLQYRPKLSFKAGLDILLSTRTLFASSFFTLVYNNGSQLTLGYFLLAEQMGILVAVNKMLRALTSLILPFTQTIFPEICILQSLEPDRARRILRFSVTGLFLLMIICAFTVYLLAPWIILIALGPGYEAAVSILRIGIFAVPLLTCEQILGAQILVPYNLERYQIRVQGIAAIASILLAMILATSWGLTGSAFLIIGIGLIITIGYVKIILKKCPQAFFKRNGAP